MEWDRGTFQEKVKTEADLSNESGPKPLFTWKSPCPKVMGLHISSARSPVFPGVSHRPAISRNSPFPDWVDWGDMVEMGLQDAARMDSFERSN